MITSFVKISKNKYFIFIENSQLSTKRGKNDLKTRNILLLKNYSKLCNKVTNQLLNNVWWSFWTFRMSNEQYWHLNQTSLTLGPRILHTSLQTSSAFFVQGYQYYHSYNLLRISSHCCSFFWSLFCFCLFYFHKSGGECKNPLD